MAISHKICCDHEDTVDPKDLPLFEIKLINKFDEDQRNIRVWYNGKPTTLYHLHSENSHKKQRQNDPGDHKQYGEEKPYDEATFFLKHDESLTVEPAEEEGDFSDLNKDLYFELPFIADYKLSFETKVWDERDRVYKPTPVDRPVTYITRNTAQEKDKTTEAGKTVVRIPGDQRAWKLQIRSPRNLKEHCRLKNVLAKHLEMTNGQSDDASVGDNGPG